MIDNHVTGNYPIAGERNNKCVMIHNKIQKQVSHLLFLKSIKLVTSPPPTYSLRASASFCRSTLKTANDLPIFASYCASLRICYCFSHLIGFFSVTWLSPLYKFTQFLFIFCFYSVFIWSYWQYTNIHILRLQKTVYSHKWLIHDAYYSVINVIFCVGMSVEIQIEI